MTFSPIQKVKIFGHFFKEEPTKLVEEKTENETALRSNNLKTKDTDLSRDVQQKEAQLPS